MDIDLWPIAGRTQLVQAFRPGEDVSKEAPFRTLRKHDWASAGVRVVTRSARRASGRLTIFSALNVEAARLAREGKGQAAAGMARAASRVEQSRSFSQLTALLNGRSSSEVAAVVEGCVEESEWPEVLEALRLLARETRGARRPRANVSMADMVVGKISGKSSGYFVLEAQTGQQTLVPPWLAQSAHREKVGDLIALVTERLDQTQMVVKAVPALSVAEGPPAAFSPFGRAARVRELSASDARYLSGSPLPLKVLVPVSIER